MLTRKYDPTQPYRYLRYGRMSSEKQNPRSPDQQFDTVETTRTRLGYPWVQVKTYRDDGISGRFMKKRTGLQAMLREIEIGRVTADLIAVDTLERLGRADEITELRRKLLTEYGILVVTADSNFADPTGVTGKALGLVENIRATEDGRVKAHNVIRGKKDAAELKWWPGGPAPLGFRLKPVLEESATSRRVHSVLEPIPAHVAAVRLAFARADETGHGALRLAKWWNECSDIPDDLKPMSPYTMGYVLSNPIYIGTLVWGANMTGIVNDTRVIEPNPDGPRVVVHDFCPPVVDRAVFDRVQQLRAARSALTKVFRAHAESGEPTKLIAPQGRGMTLKYLLTGLVRCGRCQSSMRPVPSKREAKMGRQYAYAYYACPRARSGACKNDCYVREDHLREAVVARLRSRLFPTPGAPDQVPDWFPDLVARVQQELDRHHDTEPDRKAIREAELRELGERLAGWTLTLGDPKLPSTVRTDITRHYEQAKSRQAELEAQVEGDRALGEHLSRALDSRVVVEHLHRLAEVLAGHNPTLGNLELSRHIEHVLCYPDGRVEMRGTWLGVFDGAVHLLSRTAADSPSPPDRFPGVTPRKRGRLRLPNLSAEAGAAMAEVDTSLDPERFAGLADGFFWSDDVTVERALSWAEANAVAVAQARSEGRTHEQLADEFGVSIPTVRNALRIAAQSDSGLPQLPRKMPRARWQDSHADEVWALKQEGRTVKQLAAHFEVSEPLIRAALKIAAERSNATGGPTESPPQQSGPEVE
jgi:DNA invertase Pin-like site-specific DNA recombinase